MKRNPLSQLTRPVQQPVPKAPSPRPSRKQIALRVPMPVYQVFRRMAFEEERTIQSFLMEGVDWVLARHGHPSVAEIVARSEGK